MVPLLDARRIPPARLWARPAHVVDLGSVQVPGVACQCPSHRLHDLTNEAERGGIHSSSGHDPYPHERPIPCATGSNARHAVYLRLANPSLRASRSRSAAFCDAWVETTLHPLIATSTTIHVSIGTFFMGIVHPLSLWAKLMHVARQFVAFSRTEASASITRAGQKRLKPRRADFRASHRATAVDPNRSGNMSVAGLLFAKQD